MTVTKRQYFHLSEMGINVWQKRSAILDDAQQIEPDESTGQFLPIDSTLFIDNVFFQDLLISMNCSIGDATFESDTINLGLINWRFIEKNKIDFSHNVLITPPIESLCSNAALKHELWQILNKKVLS